MGDCSLYTLHIYKDTHTYTHTYIHTHTYVCIQTNKHLLTQNQDKNLPMLFFLPPFGNNSSEWSVLPIVVAAILFKSIKTYAENFARDSLEVLGRSVAAHVVGQLVVGHLGSSGVVHEPVGGAADSRHADVDADSHVPGQLCKI